MLQFVCLSLFLSFASAYPDLLTLANQQGLTTLVSFLQSAGLDSVLKDPTQGPFTLLAPTNEAFARVPADQVANLKADATQLQEVLKYHVMNGEIFTWDLLNREVIPSLNGHSLRVYTSSTGKTLYFNQAKVNVSEIQASNGVLYIIDEVLDLPEGTIDDIILNPDYNINSFMAFLDKARLTPLFNRTSGQRYTMFVPSNDAISSMDQGLLAKIKSSYSYARYLVEYHTYPGTLHAKSLSKSGRLRTLYRNHYINVKVDANNMTTLNNVATITLPDIEAEDGVVHIISHVLIPSTLVGGLVG